MSTDFECRCCGECCRGEMHVYLNPDDLKLIAKFLGYPDTRRLFEESIIIIDYERNAAPVPRLRFSSGAFGCCPFLENRLEEHSGEYQLKGLCRLHPDFKPLVCWLAPLHRTVELETGTDSWGFKPPLPGCPGCDSGNDTEEKTPAAEITAPEEFFARLESEKEFFRRLAVMLDSGIDEDQIIKSLYHLDSDCQK
ncbi:MAG: YkgJ family cysteine cluster protein [Spirochaetales bacterium]|uniref:YkgJ family cysteine cluster protein n=1 Tax=Candidatus Thalassospirochaeta sargassi TaxID=3119039 RepID=A0AAJ1MIG1_9SPIO|nr:YkgJ family cysteine cluster protein [Spirochaetales bacterium]